MYFMLPLSWTGNYFIKTMIYVHLHGNRGEGGIRWWLLAILLFLALVYVIFGKV